MARQKATDPGAEDQTTDEAKQATAFDVMIRKMIDGMAQTVSSDLNEYQIQASILTRLAKWSKKRIGDSTICPEWETEHLPKYVTLVAQVSREQAKKTAAYMATKQKDGRKEFQDAASIVPIGSVN